jgi:hypothetical protein
MALKNRALLFVKKYQASIAEYFLSLSAMAQPK